jgi:peptidoglycan/xylan/chitin deacetylase (PgdA/CDA1 family)
MGKEDSQRIEIDGEHFEIHWYEHPGLGRFEEKQVRVNKL